MGEKIRVIIKTDVLALLSVLFLLLYSPATSPLCDAFGADSAFFYTVGKGMTDGLLPYRDFFDMKGPYLFFIEYFGQLICRGRTGAFIMQTLSLYASLWIAGTICRAGQKDSWGQLFMELLCLLPVLYIASFTFQGGNLTEELSMPLLMLSLFFALRHLRSGKRKHSVWLGFFYGFVFGVLILLRITNAALIGAILLTISVELLAAKEFKNFFANGGTFIAGCITAFIPPCVFFAAHGLLGEMLYQVFVFGVCYSSESSFWEKLLTVLMENWPMVLITALPVIVMLFFPSKERKDWVFAVSSFILTLVAVAMGNGYLHYFALGLPNIVLGIVLLRKHWKRPDFGALRKWSCRILVTIAAAALLYVQFPNFSEYTANGIKMLLGHSSYAEMKQEILTVRGIIPEEDRNNIYVYGMPTTCSNWYAMADLYPPNRYCDWQEHYIQLVPEIGDELALWLTSEDARWLVTPRDYDIRPQQIREVIETHYHVYAQTENYTLLVRTAASSGDPLILAPDRSGNA